MQVARSVPKGMRPYKPDLAYNRMIRLVLAVTAFNKIKNTYLKLPAGHTGSSRRRRRARWTARGTAIRRSGPTWCTSCRFSRVRKLCASFFNIYLKITCSVPGRLSRRPARPAGGERGGGWGVGKPFYFVIERFFKLLTR